MRDVYSPIAITLHWFMAILLIAMIYFGWYMEGLRESMLAGENVPLSDVQFAYNAHKTTGLFVLALSLFRLGWRLMHPAPGLPEGMTAIERTLAKATHWAFYAFMIGLPLGGWAAASATPFPTLLFNNPELVLPKLPVPQTEEFAAFSGKAHGFGGYALGILILLHIAAALKHQFINRDNLIARMIPLLKR